MSQISEPRSRSSASTPPQRMRPPSSRRSSTRCIWCPGHVDQGAPEVRRSTSRSSRERLGCLTSDYSHRRGKVQDRQIGARQDRRGVGVDWDTTRRAASTTRDPRYSRPARSATSAPSMVASARSQPKVMDLRRPRGGAPRAGGEGRGRKPDTPGESAELQIQRCACTSLARQIEARLRAIRGGLWHPDQLHLRG